MYVPSTRNTSTLYTQRIISFYFFKQDILTPCWLIVHITKIKTQNTENENVFLFNVNAASEHLCRKFTKLPQVLKKNKLFSPYKIHLQLVIISLSILYLLRIINAVGSTHFSHFRMLCNLNKIL